MQTRVEIAASVQDATKGMPGLIEAGSSPLRLTAEVECQTDLPDNAELIITAHEIFSRKTKVLPTDVADIAEDLDDPIHLDIGPEEFRLEPGLWHILIDIMCGEESLAGPHAGSTEVYVHPSDESPLFSTASYELGRAEYAFEREFGAYVTSYEDQIPSSIDPFSDQDADEFQDLFVRDDALFPETIHDAGTGCLLAARAYRTTGHSDRYVYCEEAVARLVRTLLELMTDDRGKVHRLLGVEEQRAHETSAAPSNSMALTFLSRVYFYFMQDPINNKSYARYVLTEAKQIFRFILKDFQETTEASVADPADPRILSGLAHYCLAHKAEHGQYFSPVALNALFDGATRIIKQISSAFPATTKTPDCSNLSHQIHLLTGLLATRRIAEVQTDRGHDEASNLLPDIHETIDAIRQDIITSDAEDAPSPVPVPANLMGNLYTAARWYQHSFNEAFCADGFPEHFHKQQRTSRLIHLGELNATGAELHFTPEYRAAPQSKEPTLFFSML